MKKIVLLVIFSIVSFAGYEENVQNRIDNRMERIENDNFVEESVIQFEEWSSELNNIYKILGDTLSDKDKELLKESQRNWILHRDKELNFLFEENVSYSRNAILICYGRNKVYFLKQRVKQLYEIYNKKLDNNTSSNYSEADKQLNKEYQELLNSINYDKSIENLRISQREWINWREKEYELYESLFQNSDEWKIKFVEDRSNLLSRYVKDYCTFN